MTSFSRLSIPTADKISDLPDSILCHILSFLPSKQAATTSILSKRWKRVWLSILALHFNAKTFKDFNSFRKFVYLTMFSMRDQKASIHSFTLKCDISSRFNQKEFDRIIKFVMQRRVENLDFDMSERQRIIKLPPRILNLKTLQLLKLANIKMGDFDQVDFPLVKTLHLDRIYFISPKYIVKFLSGCPMVEDLYTKSFVSNKSPVPMKDVNALPNLVKARICDWNTPMALFGKAKILHIDIMMSIFSEVLPVFHNLTHLELNVHEYYKVNCTWLLGILQYFPKLQHFIIKDCGYSANCYNCWKCPDTVPECISSQLKTCRIKLYRGGEYEFEFVKYIMRHSKVLEKMMVTCVLNSEILHKLSSCTSGSARCKLILG